MVGRWRALDRRVALAGLEVGQKADGIRVVGPACEVGILPLAIRAFCILLTGADDFENAPRVGASGDVLGTDRSRSQGFAGDALPDFDWGSKLLGSRAVESAGCPAGNSNDAEDEEQ